jgi:hypothetical protein
VVAIHARTIWDDDLVRLSNLKTGQFLLLCGHFLASISIYFLVITINSHVKYILDSDGKPKQEVKRPVNRAQAQLLRATLQNQHKRNNIHSLFMKESKTLVKKNSYYVQQLNLKTKQTTMMTMMLMSRFGFLGKIMLVISTMMRMMFFVWVYTAVMHYFDMQAKKTIETVCYDLTDNKDGSTESHCYPTTNLKLIIPFFDSVMWVLFEQAYILPWLMSRKKPGILRRPKRWLSGTTCSHNAKSRKRTKTVSFPAARQRKPIYYRLSTDEMMAKMASWHWVKAKLVLKGFIRDRVVEQVHLTMAHLDLDTIELSKGKTIKYGYCQQQAMIYLERMAVYQRKAGTIRTFVVAAEDSVLSIEQQEPSSGFLDDDQANDEGIQLEEAPLSTSRDEGGHHDGCTGTDDDDDDATKSNVVSGPPLLRRSARIAKLARVDYSSGGGGIQKLRRSARLAKVPRVDYRCFL